MSETDINLPPEQQAIRDKCFHPSGQFIEFPIADVETSIPARFEKIVRLFPERVAIKDKDSVVSYTELNRMSNYVAKALINHRGIEAEPISLLFENSASLVASILGILKAGKFFVLLDPSFPEARNTAVVTNSQSVLLLTDKQHLGLAAKLTSKSIQFVDTEAFLTESLDEGPPIQLSPQALVNIAYTSGSTGEPKGVINNHRNILYDAMLRTNDYHISCCDKMSLIATASSHAVKNIFLALLNGATLLPFNIQQEGAARFVNWVSREQITICRIMIQLFRELCASLTEKVTFDNLRLIQFAGDSRFPSDLELWKKYFPPTCLVANGISSSEAGCLTDGLIDQSTKLVDEIMPTGYAVPNKELLVLDENGNSLGFNQVGELAVKSPFLSPGYWQRPDLTQAKFKTDPVGGNSRIFFTGDLVLALPNGCVVYKGRKDFRVKIRGYNVEIAEIENLLRQHKSIVQAVVVAWRGERSEAYLVGYIVPCQPTPHVDELLNVLREKLPEYMIPSAIVFMDSLPYTNGKVDRKALPKPERGRPNLTIAYVSPQNDLEIQLVRIWQSVLGIDGIGIRDNFFDLGGHSLTAMRLVAEIIKHFDVVFSLQSLFGSPTVAEMARIITKLISDQRSSFEVPPLQKNNGVTVPPISRRGAGSTCPLSFGQERLWLLNQLEPESPVYNEPKLFRLVGSLDVSALEKSFNHIIMRHEVLRTTIASIDGRPVQRIEVCGKFELPVVDLSTCYAQDREGEAKRLIIETFRRPFDLSRDLMLRALLVRLSDQEHILLVVTHHIGSDAWSSEILWRELTALYGACATGRFTDLKEMPIQYADYAAWQREWLKGEELERQVSYWKKQLQGAPAVLNLPADQPRPAMQSQRGARQSISLCLELTDKLKRLSRRESVTLYMTLLAAFQTILHRYTGQEDLVVGSPIANRDRPEIEGLIGFFVNTLVLRTDLVGNPTFRELLARVRTMALEAYAHRDLPFEKLVKEFRPERSLSQSPFFQVLFNMVDAGESKLALPGLTAERLPISEVESKFDLTLYGREQNGEINLSLVYRVDLFSESWATNFLHQYSHLLEQVVSAPERRVGLYSLVTPETRELIPDPTSVIDEPLQQLVTEKFFLCVKEQAAQTAVAQGERTWNYMQLAERADTIGRALNGAGVKPGDVVAIHGRRGLGLIASMLGTFMSGGVLLLIDSQLPDQRKQLMIKEGRARKILLVGDENKDWINAEQRIDSLSIEAATGAIVNFDRSVNLKAVSLPKLSPNDPAYIFFTSGTTGIPKAVLGRHKGLSHFLDWQRQTFVITPSDRVAQLTNLSFDPVLRDIFLPLTSGATLCLPETSADPASHDTINWLQRERISILHTVPSVAETWLTSAVQPTSLPSLRWVFFAGEPVTDSLVSRWRSRLQSKTEIVNLYGPTETTLAKCSYRVPADPRSGVQPVGSPITGAQALVLSLDGQLCGINEPGEIVLRTPYRCSGYLNAPEETQKRFVRNPFREDPDDLIYLTGDVGRYRPDGTLEILGRFDDQVKVRGVRVEPAEVTAILSQHPLVAFCVVVGDRNERGETCLVAYVVASAHNLPTSAQLRSYLLDRLLTSMVPSTFVFLEALPLTPNGKVDRNALPKPDYQRREAADGFVAPRSELEKVIAGIWVEVLKLERIGIHDNFFDAGGHSLLATRVLSRVTQAFQLTVPLKVFFESPTVAQMAKVIEQTQAQTAMPGDLERLVADLENMSEIDARQVLAEERMHR